MTQPITLVVTGMPNPNASEASQACLQGVMPLLQGAGGQLVKRLKVEEALDGAPAGMVLIMDFASKDEVKAMFASDAYKALIRHRQAGFTTFSINLAGQM